MPRIFAMLQGRICDYFFGVPVLVLAAHDLWSYAILQLRDLLLCPLQWLENQPYASVWGKEV